MAAAGPCAVSLLGTTFGDNLLSILVLAAFLLLLQVADEPDRAGVWRLVLAGVLGGAATGLKLTFATSLVALLASVLCLALRTRNAWAPVAFGAGSALGVPLTAGYWGLQMWQRFGNPIFPFANNVFRSPYLPPVALRDARWAPRGGPTSSPPRSRWRSGLTDRLQEVEFRDVRDTSSCS